MDLVAGVKRCIVTMDHTNRKGDPKILKACTLPLTGQKCIDRIITDLGVFDVADGGIKVAELAPDVTLDEVRAKTEATIVD